MRKKIIGVLLAVAMATCTACGSVKTMEQSTVETETTETTEMAARTEDLLTQEQHGEHCVFLSHGRM